MGPKPMRKKLNYTTKEVYSMLENDTSDTDNLTASEDDTQDAGSETGSADSNMVIGPSGDEKQNDRPPEQLPVMLLQTETPTNASNPEQAIGDERQDRDSIVPQCEEELSPIQAFPTTDGVEDLPKQRSDKASGDARQDQDTFVPQHCEEGLPPAQDVPSTDGENLPDPLLDEEFSFSNELTDSMLQAFNQLIEMSVPNNVLQNYPQGNTQCEMHNFTEPSIPSETDNCQTDISPPLVLNDPECDIYESQIPQSLVLNNTMNRSPASPATPNNDTEEAPVSSSRAEQEDRPDKDPDYEVQTASGSSDSENENLQQPEPTRRSRRKKPAPDEWKMNIPKMKRLKGESHTSRRGHIRDEKKLGEACSSNFCRKSSLRQCEKLTHEDRNEIYQNFWKLGSWSERRTFVKAMVTSVPKKQKKTESGRREHTFNYYVKTKIGTSLQTCKKTFCSTIGLSERTVGDWLNNGSEKDKDQTPLKERASEAEGSRTSYATKKISDDDNLYLKEWLLKIPCVDSHYCRKVPAYKDKRFLEPGTKLQNLYKIYSEDAPRQNRRVVGFTHFNKVFKSLHFSTFIPRKDQCDTCISAKMGNITPEEHKKHIDRKDKARAQKETDKQKGSEDPSISVWTMDTQAVMMCPQSKASALYYRTKLQVHNFTLFNLCTKDGYCYMWDETNGSLSSEIFAYIQYKHFKDVLKANEKIKEVIIYSDGCGYQNKNSYLSNMYFVLAQETGVQFTQKYLVSGHTNMECDSMHSTIERNLVTDIFTPRDLKIIMETARINPQPYYVKQLQYKDFKKMSTLHFNSIRPGKKTGDPTVQMVTTLAYSSDGQVQYKLDHENDTVLTPLPIRIKEYNAARLKWIPMFDQPIPITQRKYMDLQAMKKVMDAEVHAFYDQLRYQ